MAARIIRSYFRGKAAVKGGEMYVRTIVNNGHTLGVTR